MQMLEEIGSNPAVMKWTGAVILALIGFGFMRVRKHPMRDSLAFGGGILGMCIILSLIKAFLF
ncbi:MAG: hypothetical protein IJ109_09575 [Firmicutes bacterium]|nr:hypothetical protein [Bacillota bacterium]